MFARNTPTRMKGSAVVQGLKSLVSKLHPQLPLSAKESQRLLTALTTSFRKQLDQAHPSQPVGEANTHPPSKHVLPKPGSKQLHSSSATFADKHLASVLTSPLLSKAEHAQKPSLGLESAEAELQSNPSSDPILLLEEYHQKGAATVPIALLCLEKVDQSLSTLSDEKREAAIHEANAGKRVLLWLWKSNLYETDAFVENVDFMTYLCKFLVRERADQCFWDWWKLDMTLGNQEGPGKSSRYAKNIYHSYRWRNRMLRNFVHAKFYQSKEPSPNSAVEAFLLACDIKEAAIAQRRNRAQFTLLGAWHVLAEGFGRHRSCLKNTDPQLFDRMLQRAYLVAGSQSTGDNVVGKTDATDFYRGAIMWLLHPLKPSPLPVLHFLRALEAAEYAKKEGIYQYMTGQKSGQRAKAMYYSMIRAVVLLRADARSEDAKWIIDFITRLYPDMAQKVEKDVKAERVIYERGPLRGISKASHNDGPRSPEKTDSFIRLDLGSL